MKNSKAIHQFTPSVAHGDSVSNGLLFVQKLLHELGFKSNIYICDKAVSIDFKNEVFHIEQYEQSDEQVLLYHHSIGHVCHDKLMSFEDKKVLIYHNITPSHFFKDEKHLQVACDEGREQLKSGVSSFIGSIGDSDYNCQELKAYSYPSPATLPLLMDLDKKSTVIPNEKIVQKYHTSYNILFVGRVVQNKCQHQLIDVLQELKLLGELNIKLFIVGGVSQPNYFEFLNDYAMNLGLDADIIITNKVSDEDLAAYYKAADLYLSLSEHEGFGIPLIEAMKYDIPVLAYNAGGIASTLTKFSLLEKKSPRYIAKEIIELQRDPYFRVELLKAQKLHLNSFSHENMKKRLAEYLKSIGVDIGTRINSGTNIGNHLRTDTVNYQIEGPFDSSYSLAIVNKTIANALNDNTDSNVALYSTEGGGDFEPDWIKIASDSSKDSTKILATKILRDVDVSIRNLYPPRTNAMRGYHKIIGPYGWEESKFPSEYVQWFNQKTSMVFAMSDYVKNLLKDNGVYTPIRTIGLIVEDILTCDSQSFSFELPTNFKLLHISSAFARKGVYGLLKAFVSLDSDLDISLIIKTFPNPHNNTELELKDLGFVISDSYEKDVSLYTKDKKQVLLINKDITRKQMKHLYENSHLLVAPSFGEGFGLPLAEAMLLDLPVLTTAFGGQTDFCTDETSWLLDFDFELSSSHMNLSPSFWAVPKISAIKDSIEYIYHLQQSELDLKTKKAKEYILKHYSSKQIVQNIQDAIKNYPSKKPEKKIALFSTYNTKCGIASYAKHLISSFEDEVLILAPDTADVLVEQESSNTVRCWSDGRETQDIELLKENLSSNDITGIIIQYNFSFIPLNLLEELVDFCCEKKIDTHLFLHSSHDVVQETYTDSFRTITKSLQKVSKIYVHTLADMNYLKDFNIYKNTYLFTHGISDINITLKASRVNSASFYGNTQTLATFGFLLPQKGILELVDVLKALHSQGIKVKLLLLTSIHPAPVSKELYIQLKQKIKESGLSNYITLNTDFLDEKEIVDKLSLADKILFLYKDTQESSSAAVRMGLLSQKEVITTPISIFDDVKSVVTQTKDNSLESVCECISNSLTNNYDNSKQKNWCNENSWKNISKKFYNSIKNETYAE